MTRKWTGGAHTPTRSVQCPPEVLCAEILRLSPPRFTPAGGEGIFTERNKRTVVLSIVCVALVAFGCGGATQPLRKPPEAPQKAAIEAAVQGYEKHKEAGDLQVPISENRDCLRMLAVSWGNYEYAQKELAKMAVQLQEARDVAGVDLAVEQTRTADAEAQRDRYRGQRWWFLAGGLAGGVVAAILVGLAL